MRIELEGIGRRYNRDWIFKDISASFERGNSYALLGPNGSGKSTLMKVIAGSLTPSEGAIRYILNEEIISEEKIYSYVSYAAPYIELIEEFTLREIIEFHFRFKKILLEFDEMDLRSTLGLEASLDKQFKYFSSGMKQRVKLCLACFTDSPVLLLDEPMSNLDIQGENWCLDLIRKTVNKDRVMIIASNQEKEYAICDVQLNVLDYK